MDVLPLLSLGLDSVRLAGPARYTLNNATVYENASDLDVRMGNLVKQHIYVERNVKVDEVSLVRLGEAVMYAAADYLVRIDKAFVKEQVPPWHAPETFISAALSSQAPIEIINDDTVIIARFGCGTWGHWLGELLPKMVLVENIFPNRFFYAIPRAYEEVAWRTFRESISVYGIPPQRLVFLDEQKNYQLTRAWGVTPIWSDHVMNPAVGEVMRNALRLPHNSGGPRKVALLRQCSAARSVHNWQDIQDVLTERDFTLIDIAALKFWEQARIFREAETVFSVLGSGLTGIMYSPLGVRVTSVAPSVFADRFFYGLITDRRGRYADVRGPIEELDHTIAHRSSFVINPDTLEKGLAALE